MMDPAGSIRMKFSTKIPRIKLDTEVIANRAEAIPGAKVYASDLPSAYLIRHDEEVIIITRHKGYLSLNAEDIPSLIEELANTLEDIKRRL